MPDAQSLSADALRRQEFPLRLLVWYRSVKRDLPWRKTRDPYAIWVSEMMLQQTQVATVTPYWNRWLERFPTISDLANAPLEDVLKQWQGLGYYARARNMHKAAQVIVSRYGGVFPTRFEDVLALPGIGKYTAGAVCSIAYDQNVPLVDANVIRVLCRIFGICGDPKSLDVQQQLWKLAGELIPGGEAADFNQAMMELGALVCIKKPRCEACPIQSVCAAYATGNPESLPQFAPKAAFTEQIDVCAVVSHLSGDSRILFIRRPEGGLWGGLWELPRITLVDNETPLQGAERAARDRAGLSVRILSETPVAKLRHGVTTRKIALLALSCIPVDDAPPISENSTESDAFAWLSPEETDQYPLSSPQAKLMAQLREERTQLSLFE